MPNRQEIAVDSAATSGSIAPPLPADPPSAVHQPDAEAGGSAVAEPVPPPPLQSIFDCQKIKRGVVKDGVVGWVCGWCGQFFKGGHATRALKHVLKLTLKAGVRPCPAEIPDPFINR